MAVGVFEDQLLEKIRKSFTGQLNHDKIAQKFQWKIMTKTADLGEAEKYAARVGELLAEAIENELTEGALPGGMLTKEAADHILRWLLSDDYNLVTEATAQTMEALNQAAGLRMNAIKPEIDADRVSGLVDKVTSYENFEDAKWILKEPVTNFSQHVADRMIEENVEAHFRAGLSPKITRKAEGNCCKWCAALAGKYDYPVPREIYRRHENCRCLVLYDPGDGKVQNAHTKKVYVDAREAERESRRERTEEILQKSAEKRREKLLQPLLDKPENLKKWSPGGLKTYLEKQGFDVKPLAQGSLKGIPFEEGGGWKINFGDGGLVQYHPATKSHHDGEYWRISTGKGGIQRYDRDGKPKEK